MPAKIKKRLKALSFAEQAKPRFFKMVDRFIKEMIVDYIQKGISPVKMRTAKEKNTGGKNRFVQYSDSYIAQMNNEVAFRKIGDKVVPITGTKDKIEDWNEHLKGKKQRPINLTLSGKMLKSIKSIKTKNSVRIWFSDEKAKYHNIKGAGKSKTIRRILPTDGEEWAVKIEKAIVSALEKAIRLSKR